MVIIAALAACDRPTTLVICHNANCAEPVDPRRDDTLEAMRESLALEYQGRPAIDGVEIDSFWRGADAACLFAHDLEQAQMTPAMDAANELAAHLASHPPPLAFSGQPFRVLLELKSHVAADTGVRHTPEQRELHAQCAWQMYTAIADAAVANDHEIVFIFSAFAPELLRAITANRPAVTPMPFELGAIQGVPAPLDDQTRPLSDYAGIELDMIEVHNQWLLDGQFDAIDRSRVDLAFWMFSATVETFSAIEQYEPELVVASEAQLVRRWLER